MKIDRIAWLQRRQQYICSTDITRLLGLAPDTWGGQHRVWREKTEPVTEDTASPELFVWGHKLQPVIAAHYGDVLGESLEDFEATYVTPWPHRSIPHVAATPDYVQGGNGQHPASTVVVECKNVHEFMKPEWGESGSVANENVPAHYVAQVQWQIGCLGAKGGVITCLIGGHDWRWYPVEHDPVWFDAAAAHATRWYADHVVANVAPPPDFRNDFVLDDAPAMANALIAGDDIEALLLELWSRKQEQVHATEQMQTLELALMREMGTAYTQINRRDGTVAVTWRPGKNGRRPFVVKYKALDASLEISG